MACFYRSIVAAFSRLFLCLALCMPLLASAQEHVAPVNINSASAETLADALEGVGMSKAQAIIAYRDVHGPFTDAEQLTKVKGIGVTTLANNRERIALN